MDITELSMSLSQNKLLTAVGTAMLGKTLDVMEGQAQLFTEGIDMSAPSLESLVYPTSGTMIDMRVWVINVFGFYDMKGAYRLGPFFVEKL